jgi:hypothetical protein
MTKPILSTATQHRSPDGIALLAGTNSMNIQCVIRKLVFLAAAFILATAPALAGDEVNKASENANGGLEDDVQALKQEVLDINRELFMIEEDILYPESTQFTVFVSLDIGAFFALDSIQLRIDDKIVANYLYTKRELAALKKGGVQQLYQGNLKSGPHEITAYFIGKGPHNRDYKRGVTRTITKSLSPLFAELKIVDNTSQEQPDFDLGIWDN